MAILPKEDTRSRPKPVRKPRRQYTWRTRKNWFLAFLLPLIGLFATCAWIEDRSTVFQTWNSFSLLSDIGITLENISTAYFQFSFVLAISLVLISVSVINSILLMQDNFKWSPRCLVQGVKTEESVMTMQEEVHGTETTDVKLSNEQATLQNTTAAKPHDLDSELKVNISMTSLKQTLEGETDILTTHEQEPGQGIDHVTSQNDVLNVPEAVGQQRHEAERTEDGWKTSESSGELLPQFDNVNKALNFDVGDPLTESESCASRRLSGRTSNSSTSLNIDILPVSPSCGCLAPNVADRNRSQNSENPQHDEVGSLRMPANLLAHRVSKLSNDVVRASTGLTNKYHDRRKSDISCEVGSSELIKTDTSVGEICKKGNFHPNGDVMSEMVETKCASTMTGEHTTNACTGTHLNPCKLIRHCSTSTAGQLVRNLRRARRRQPGQSAARVMAGVETAEDATKWRRAFSRYRHKMGAFWQLIDKKSQMVGSTSCRVSTIEAEIKDARMDISRWLKDRLNNQCKMNSALVDVIESKMDDPVSARGTPKQGETTSVLLDASRLHGSERLEQR